MMDENGNFSETQSNIENIRACDLNTKQDDEILENDIKIFPKIKVKTLSELQLSNIDNAVTITTKINNETKDNNIIELSSDDNEGAQFSQKSTTTKKKQIKNNRKSKTTKKRNNKKRKDKNLEERETETPIIKRKLMKSTNIKTFPSKFQPESQTRIDSYFQSTLKSEKISYFNTFSQSKPSELTEGCVADYVDIVTEEIKRRQFNGREIRLINEIIDLSDDDEMEGVIEKNEDKSNAQETIKEINEKSISAYYSQRKQNSKTKSKSIENCDNKNTENEENLSDDDNAEVSSSLIFKYKLPEEKAESVDYTPPKVRQKIESIRKANMEQGGISDDEDEIKNHKYKRKQSARKKLSFHTGQIPQKISKECKNSNLAEVKTQVNFASKDTEKARPTRSSRKRSFESSSAAGTSNEPVTINAKIDLTVDVTPCKYFKNASRTSVNCNAKINLKGKCKESSNSVKKNSKRIVKCPNYKIIEGTTFAVDAFRFGDIEGITHYFLTHFHADHYMGLKKSFNKPIYLSEITARLVAGFIHTSNEYLNMMKLNEPIMVNHIEVTALDANHCPGAVMFLFKFPNGLCTLHTGDFRACPEMESEPIFWNNTIHTIYLDTTYLSSRYDFMSQSESVQEVLNSIIDFQKKHIGQRVLYVCGSYVIGKEKVWMEIARNNNFKVWTDGNRRKALEIINDRNILEVLVNDPSFANVHIITLGQLSYDYLSAYLDKYSDHFDVLFAIRPSGWEKNSKPQYRGRINIKGIEYSEHSSYNELRRFVRFLQPQKLISTVSSSNDLSKTNKIPNSWLHNQIKPRTRGYQQSITNFLKNVGSKPENLNLSVTVSEYDDKDKHQQHHQVLDANLINEEKWYVISWLFNQNVRNCGEISLDFKNDKVEGKPLGPPTEKNIPKNDDQTSELPSDWMS